MQGFLLGLANGGTCLAYCAPVLVPYLLGEGKNSRQNIFILCQFLAGRLLGYLIFAIVAWFVSSYVTNLSVYKELLMGMIYVILSILLWSYSRRGSPSIPCSARSLKGITSQVKLIHPAVMPLFMGLLTGLNLCPPFLLVFADALSTQTIFQSILYFFSFFLGTSVYFLPMPFLGFLKDCFPLQSIGKMAAILMSAYYFYTGIIMLIGGINYI